MGLQIWLPLISDLHNQGLSDSTVTNNGATLNTNGKLGGCYSFNGSSSYLLGTHNIITNNTDEWSFTCWMKLNATTQGQCLFSCRTGINSTGITIFYYGSYWLIDDGARWQFTPTITIAKDTWYHICVVRKKGIGKYLYVNGALDSSTTTVGTQSTVCTTNYSIGNSQQNATIAGGNPLNGYLNDIRFYDHALSQKEIKELSKGLVCHYKLTGWLDGINPNMLKETPKGYTPTAYCGYQLDFTENLVAGETYTLQLWDVNVSHAGKTESTLGITVYWGGGSVSICSWQGTNYFTDGHADYLSKTFTITSSQASGSGATNLWFNIYNSVPSASGDKNMVIGHWKLEKGSVATPYVKTIEEMGGEDTTVYDSSGYNYHGQTWAYDTNGDIEISSSTPRYSVSTFINSANPTTNTASGTQYIYGSCTLKAPDRLTVAFWDYPISGYNSSTGQGQLSLTNYAIGNDAGVDYQTAPLNHRDAGFDVNDSAGTIHKRLVATFTANEWHHYAITYDGRYAHMYKDGVETTSVDMGSNVALGDMCGIVLGFSKAGGAWRKNQSKYSDFRLYSTCLSANDILELYHTGQSISKNKSLFAYEFIEPYNGELMNVRYTSSYVSHSEASPWIHYNTDGEAIFTGNGQSIGSVYVPVSPTGKTYYYDMMLSINAGNQFYVGFERYDKDFTPRSNQACVYVYASKPTADVVKVRYRGTVNLSTDSVNPCAYIALRILNGWSGTTSGVTGQATIHYLSLREVTTANGFHTSFSKKGIATTDLFLEKNGTGDIEKTGIINMINFIES